MKNIMSKIICQLCKEEIETPDFGDGTFDYSDVYEYRGFSFHEKCFDEGIKRVDEKRQEVTEETEHSLKSQAGGEWMNGGYRTMKTDPHTGKPLLKNPKQPQKLTDYEDGIL
jgi:hypothetical protein